MGANTFHSSINTDRFEIVKTGNSFWPSLSVVGGGASGFGTGEALTTIAHNLGYKPAVIGYVQELGVAVTQNYVTPSFSYFGNSSSALWIVFSIAADSTNLYISTTMMTWGVTGTSSLLGGANGGFICQYYLLREQIKRTS